MTRPDEIAALADRLELHTKELANQPLCMTMGHWSQLSNDILAAAEALRLSATSPGDAVREVLRAHWLHQIVCNHEDGTDKPCCSCSMWNCPPQPSIGAAVEAWIDHVIEHLTKANVDNAALPGHDWQLSDETKANLKAIDDHQRASAATVSTMICGSAALATAEKAGDDLCNCSWGCVEATNCRRTATPTPPSADVAWLIQRLRSWEKDPAATHRVNGRTRRLLKEAATMLAIQSAAPGGGTKSDGRGQVASTECAVTGASPPDTPCIAAPEVAPGPSDPAQEPEAVALDIADEFISVCEPAARQAKRTGNTFVLDRQRVANLIQAKLTRLTRPVSLDREAVARIIDPTAQGDYRRSERQHKADAILALIEGRT